MRLGNRQDDAKVAKENGKVAKDLPELFFATFQ